MSEEASTASNDTAAPFILIGQKSLQPYTFRIRQPWTQDLERAVQPLGHFRQGPKLVLFASSAAERLLLACKARCIDPSILSPTMCETKQVTLSYHPVLSQTKHKLWTIDVSLPRVCS